jgi:hypothetical protein
MAAAAGADATEQMSMRELRDDLIKKRQSVLESLGLNSNLVAWKALVKKAKAKPKKHTISRRSYRIRPVPPAVRKGLEAIAEERESAALTAAISQGKTRKQLRGNLALLKAAETLPERHTIGGPLMPVHGFMPKQPSKPVTRSSAKSIAVNAANRTRKN